jgi:hypothetical protein
MVHPKVEQKLAYVNRKNFTSLNVLIVAGANGKIYYLTSNSPGSYHDSAVFKTSQLWDIMSNGDFLPFPGALILADSAYETFHPWMCTPFSDLSQDIDERRFNKTFCRARVCIEQTIGRLKNKFRCLMNGGLRFKDLEVCAKAVQVCAALHNFILTHEGTQGTIHEDESFFAEDITSEDEVQQPITSSPIRRRQPVVRTCQHVKDLYF